MKLTIEMMMPPSNAVQNPSTCQPISNKPASHEVSKSMQALITIRNRPSVSSISGSVNESEDWLDDRVEHSEDQRHDQQRQDLAWWCSSRSG